jgi:hypothetical protein
MFRKLLAIAVTVISMAAFGVAAASARAPQDPTLRVESQGKTTFQPNNQIQSTLRFEPGILQSVPSGAQVRFTVNDHDGKNDAHTVTVADPADIPNTVPKIFNCGSDPNDPCGQTFKCLFGGGQPVFKCDPDQVPGLDQPGDVLLFTATHPTTTHITAPPGTVLHYFCAFHPWMQGVIRVV